MYLIRDIMHCKPGKVRAMVEKFTMLSNVGEKVGMPKMRIMTDFCAEQYWTVIAEMEVADLAEFERMMRMEGMSDEDGKKMQEVMKDYHDLVDHGRREIYRLET